MMGISGEECCGWNCQERGNGGRPKRMYMDAVREDMAVVEVTEEDAEDRTKWRWKISIWSYLLSLMEEAERRRRRIRVINIIRTHNKLNTDCNLKCKLR